jgi:hypothetical protein
MANNKMTEGFDYDSVNGYYVGGIFKKVGDVLQPLSFEEYMTEELARKDKEEEFRKINESRVTFSVTESEANISSQAFSIAGPGGPIFREDETFEVVYRLWERLGWVRVSETLLCDPRLPKCSISRTVQQTFGVQANVSVTAKLSEMISATVGFSWTWSWSFSTTYSFDLKPGQNAYIAVSGVGFHVKGNHKWFQNGNLIKQKWVDCISPDPNGEVFVKAVLV